VSPPRLLAGASGFAYKPWKGTFYPADIKDAEMLGYYARQLPTVEINNTFYRMPKASVLEGWAGAVPEGFCFVIKASRRITHLARLKDCGEPLDFLLTNLRALGDRLGPLLFQLPPNLKPDTGRLGAFLSLLDQARATMPCRVAFEFRHPGWFDEPVYALLRDHGAALVLADHADQQAATPFVPTGPFGYLRLRRDGYTDADLEAWAARIAGQPWDEAYVFFKHEDAGTAPQFARRLLEQISQGRTTPT
jgi:uncharacterized protein YecE (DUF72 family)